MRISDWSSDVCSSDLEIGDVAHHEHFARSAVEDHGGVDAAVGTGDHHHLGRLALVGENVETGALGGIGALAEPAVAGDKIIDAIHRSEEHTSELQSLMRISYAVFCLKKKIRTSL